MSLSLLSDGLVVLIVFINLTDLYELLDKEEWLQTIVT